MLWRLPNTEAATRPISVAMHVHSSFSEGSASMHQQLASAKTNAIDVIWWSDHDWRINAHGYRNTVGFTALTEYENGVAIRWKKVQSTTGIASTALKIVKTPASPKDPSTPSSLSVSGTGTTPTFATVRAVGTGDRDNVRSTLAGQSISLEVFPAAIGPDVFSEVRITSSTHPVSSARPAGQPVLSYRFGGPDPPGTIRAEGLTGIVVLPTTAKTWNSVTLSPSADAALLWPDLDIDDLSMCELSLGVQSRNSVPARAYFDYLRFSRMTDKSAALDVQRRLMADYAPSFPTVTQHQGLEVSLYAQHVNWFGGDVALFDYGDAPILPLSDDQAATIAQVDTIHTAGGIASLNHMFGTGNSLVSVDEQDRRRQALASTLIANNAYGVDILEVGYRQRGGADLPHHLAVWDACSRNGMFLTGNGVSDDHSGVGWRGSIRNFFTYLWAADASEAALLDAIARGRCYFADLQRFSGQLDLLVDGTCPMGSVSISQLATRTLRIIVSRIPTGGWAEVVAGPVDHPGAADPNAATISTTIPASAFAPGFADVAIDTSSSRFARVVVRDASGQIVAGSNPVWLLTEQGPTKIPPQRLV